MEKTVYILYPDVVGTVSPEIYGVFAEHIGGVFYDGLWVGEESEVPNIKGFRREIVEKMRAAKIPAVRWPGGCYAETYDWRDGVGEHRPRRVSWWTGRDGKYESNTVGTHEFMDFCEAVGAAPYFAANLTTVSPMHIIRWMDYCLSPRGTTELALERERNGHPEPFCIPYWGVGNENWGGGGNMRPEYYADEFRRYATVMRNVAPKVNLFACGQNHSDFAWTDGVVRGIKDHPELVDGFAMHFYCNGPGDPLDFGPEEWDEMIFRAADIENAIIRDWNIICGMDMGERCRLVIDEWGCWHRDGSGPSRGANLFEQQSTVRDAAVTALTLNIFNNHCEKIRMANVAQLVNNLHALFLAGGEHCIETPTYHVFDMFKEHQGASAVRTLVTDNGELTSSVSVSASVKEGKTLLTAANLSCREDATLKLRGVGEALPPSAEGVLLQAGDMCACNTFENLNAVAPRPVTVDLSKPVTLPKTAVLAVRW